MGGRGSKSATASRVSASGPESFKMADGGTMAYHAEQTAKLQSADYEDGTYNLSTLGAVEYSSGYQVTFCQIGDNYSPDEYAELCNEFLAVSSDGIVAAGKFEGTAEISFHVENVDTAVALARKYNQISIWDWSSFDEIKTGGTGRR